VRYAAYWHERSHKDAGHRWLRQLVVEEARSLAIAP
jgi:DNA-binding transcriptional LysR family regulator